jgi:hypothetical protein
MADNLLKQGTSLLKPEVSLGIALATAGVVAAIYMNATPSMADIRSADSENTDIDSSRKMAAWMSAGVVSAISLIARDTTIFVVGGGMVIVMDWLTRHSNSVSPVFGKITHPTGGDAMQAAASVTPDTGGVLAGDQAW